ncbi:MAG: dihydrolipoamide acetyltransferase family protein [Chloroflexota bacterium]
MAIPILLPKQGNTVESCIILKWLKSAGDEIAAGDVLCEVETDKAALEVESPESGTLLNLFFNEGDEVPVLTVIAALGKPGEDGSYLAPSHEQAVASSGSNANPVNNEMRKMVQKDTSIVSDSPDRLLISPRALRRLANSTAIDWESLSGTGPNGRIIERDIENAVAAEPQITPVAKRMLDSGDYVPPESVKQKRLRSKDLVPAFATLTDDVTIIPLKGIRKTIATRMHEASQQTAPFTLHSSADARTIKAYRARLKASDPALSLAAVSINDLVHFAVVKTLQAHSALNSLLIENEILQYQPVHLGFAVDTEAGLMVPVIKYADQLSLRQLAEQAKELANLCRNRSIKPDDLNGGTFTVSNLGGFGIEAFTPVINVPQVGILGVNNIQLKPIETTTGDVEFIPRLGLSLTVDHRVIDGGPGARFMQALVKHIEQIDLLTAV